MLSASLATANIQANEVSRIDENLVSKASVNLNEVMAGGNWGAGNGGDTSCELQIQTIREDLRKWILAGEYTKLDFSNSNISKSDYRKKMLNAMKADISCTDKIQRVKRAEKTCKNFANRYDHSQSIMICNFNRFNNTVEEEQYRLIHHEYAGLAGIEKNLGNEESDYNLSDQISGQLEERVVKRLAIAAGIEDIFNAKKYFEDVHGKYGCSYSKRSNDMYCKQINKEKLAYIKNTFIKTEDERLELLDRYLGQAEDLQQKYNEIAKEELALGNTNFANVILSISENMKEHLLRKVLLKFNQPDREFPNNYLSLDRFNNSFDQVRRNLSVDGDYFKKLVELEREINSEDYRDYSYWHLTGELIEVNEIFQSTLVELKKEINPGFITYFDLNEFIEFDSSCDREVERGFQRLDDLKTLFLDRETYSDNEANFLNYRKAFRSILDRKDGKKLTIKCEFGWMDDQHHTYSENDHSLLVNYRMWGNRYGKVVNTYAARTDRDFFESFFKELNN